jgi:hypothetical protein
VYEAKIARKTVPIMQYPELENLEEDSEENPEENPEEEASEEEPEDSEGLSEGTESAHFDIDTVMGQTAEGTVVEAESESEEESSEESSEEELSRPIDNFIYFDNLHERISDIKVNTVSYGIDHFMTLDYGSLEWSEPRELWLLDSFGEYKSLMAIGSVLFLRMKEMENLKMIDGEEYTGSLHRRLGFIINNHSQLGITQFVLSVENLNSNALPVPYDIGVLNKVFHPQFELVSIRKLGSTLFVKVDKKY